MSQWGWVGVVAALVLMAAGFSFVSSSPSSTVVSVATSSTVALSTTTTTVVPSSVVVRPGSLWRPAPGTTWQWQLTGSIDTSVAAEMYDVDLFDVSAGTVAVLKGQGKAVVCYMSAGSWEDWRPDAGDFPDSVKGRSNGWAGEKWLDIRRLDVLGPIMEARMDLCVAKGFDAVEPDNIDGYSNRTGFPLAAADQLAYNKFLANAAHPRGLSIGLKNDVEQAAALEPWFDWALNEECFAYDECSELSVFVANGKAVFHVEYGHAPSEFCPVTVPLGFSSMRKRMDLDAWLEQCP